jgi:hypothetical protein
MASSPEATTTAGTSIAGQRPRCEPALLSYEKGDLSCVRKGRVDVLLVEIEGGLDRFSQVGLLILE